MFDRPRFESCGDNIYWAGGQVFFSGDEKDENGEWQSQVRAPHAPYAGGYCLLATQPEVRADVLSSVFFYKERYKMHGISCQSSLCTSN
jgi:hypothetical protein